MLPRSRLRLGHMLALVAAWSVAGCTAPDWQGRAEPALRDYQAAFARDVGTRFVAAAALDDVLALTANAQVLWLGDHHRSEALHERQLELLARLHRQGRPLCLCLEAIGAQDQPDVDAYLAGRIDMDLLVAQVRHRWPGAWLGAADVDRDHYRRLLAFAKATATPVLALEPTPRLPLAKRDPVIAQSVADAVRRHPDRLVVVVVGQAHLLGEGRLPQRTGEFGPVLGAEPTPQLRRAGPPVPPRAQTGPLLWRTDTGVWFFADLPPAR